MFARPDTIKSQSNNDTPTRTSAILKRASIDAKVGSQQIAGLYKKAATPFLTVVFNSGFLVYLLRTQVDASILTLWLSLILTTTLSRVLLRSYYLRADQTDQEARRWGHYFTAGVFANGFLWGAAGIVLFPVDSLSHQVMLAFVIGGMSAGAAGSTSSHRPAYLAFIVPAMLPITVRFFIEADEPHMSMGAMLLIFTAAILVTAKKSGDALNIATCLQMENSAYAEVLRKRNEQASTRFRVLLEQTGALIFVAEADSHTIIDASDNSASLLGTSVEDLMGKKLEEVHLVDTLTSRTGWDQVVATAHREGECRVQDVRQESDAAPRHLELLVSTRKFAGAEYVLVVGSDVSARRQLENELEHNRRLAGLGQLAAGVAHEINNPLSYVLENLRFVQSEIAETKNLDDDVLGELESALTDTLFGAEQIRRIVYDLSILARRDQRSDDNSELLDVIEGSLKLAENKVRHHARLIRDYNKVPSVVGDSGRLGQVILNLVVNAAQAIPSGNSDENTITVCTSATDSDKVFVDVIDTGPGIPPEILSRIFDPFFTTKDVGEGTGLGLAICDSIIRDLGGQISVKSTLGEGTRFRVELMVAQAHVQDGIVETPERATVTPSRILVVDDEIRVARSLTRLLNQHEVVVAIGGDKAMLALDDLAEYDVILCDVMMPNVSGMQLYKHVAKTLPGLEQRFIFMTGGVFTDEARCFLDSIPNPYLLKPLDLARLQQQIDETLRACGSKQQASQPVRNAVGS